MTIESKGIISTILESQGPSTEYICKSRVQSGSEWALDVLHTRKRTLSVRAPAAHSSDTHHSSATNSSQRKDLGVNRIQSVHKRLCW